MNEKILKLLENNARLSAEDIASALDMDAREVEREIAEMERVGVIRGYKCVIDKEKLCDDSVTAIIELKVTPTAGLGFEEVAEKISHYESVESVSLLSGACDLAVTVRGKSFREVAAFVSRELATIESVSSTATQFVMRRYKELGVELFGNEDDGRGKISL